MFGVFLAFVVVFVILLFILFATVHRKTNFLANLYWDNKYSDSNSTVLPEPFGQEDSPQQTNKAATTV